MLHITAVTKNIVSKLQDRRDSMATSASDKCFHCLPPIKSNQFWVQITAARPLLRPADKQSIYIRAATLSCLYRQNVKLYGVKWLKYVQHFFRMKKNFMKTELYTQMIGKNISPMISFQHFLLKYMKSDKNRIMYNIEQENIKHCLPILNEFQNTSYRCSVHMLRRVQHLC